MSVLGLTATIVAYAGKPARRMTGEAPLALVEGCWRLPEQRTPSGTAQKLRHEAHLGRLVAHHTGTPDAPGWLT